MSSNITSDAKDVTFTLKVMTNKEKTKVLYAEADSDFVDVLLSFLALPLGRIVKVLGKHYGDKAPVVGSLTTLYNGLANLDNAHFWTEGAKLMLLDPRSSFEDHLRRLKLDMSDSPIVIFTCEKCNSTLEDTSMYCVDVQCRHCGKSMKNEVGKNKSHGNSGVFTRKTASFIISDDLHILPNVAGLLQTISILGITDMDIQAEQMDVTFGLSEIMDLLKASIVSQTTLTDLILNRKGKMNSAKANSELGFPLSHRFEKQVASSSKKMILKLMVQKSTNKLLFAQADDDFIHFLSSFLIIPLGGVEYLFDGNTCLKNIDNLYRSVAVLIDEKYQNLPRYTTNRLINPDLPHGCISRDSILPLTVEELPDEYKDHWSTLYSYKFLSGRGIYVKGLRSYKVTDDLTVMPLCIASFISFLNKLKIPISDIEELELQIGLAEALSILEASLTSTSALTNGLLSHIPKKQPKQEH